MHKLNSGRLTFTDTNCYYLYLAEWKCERTLLHVLDVQYKIYHVHGPWIILIDAVFNGLTLERSQDA